MIFCTKCGKQLEDDAKFCTGCGAVVGETKPAENQPVPPQPAAAPAASASVSMAGLLETKDETAGMDAHDIDENKAMAVFSYLGILVLVPLFAAKNSKFARFHANQGLLVLIASLAVSLVGSLLSTLLGLISGWLGSIVGALFGLLSLPVLALAILGIVNAVQGKAKELPVIGKIHLLK